MQRLLLSCSLLSLTLLIGCERASLTSTPAPTPDDDAPRAPISWQTETPEFTPELDEALRQVLKNCELADGVPGKCEGEADLIAKKSFSAHPYEAIATLTVAVSSEDQRRREYASWMLQEAFPVESFEALREAPERVTPDVVERLMEATQRSEPLVSARLARTTSYLATLHRKQDAWLVILEAHPDIETRRAGYAAALRFSPPETIDVLRHISLDGSQPVAVRRAALSAPMELLPWRDELSRERVCEWMVAALNIEQPELEVWPAKLLSTCPSQEGQALLSALQQRIDEGRFGPPFSEGVDALCAVNQPSASMTPHQCDDLFDTYERAIENGKLSLTGRAEAMRLLAMNRPDGRTAELLETLIKGKKLDADLEQAARRELDALTARSR